MQREANIPLFLWIATAVVAHGIWGGGVDKASRLIGETLEIRDFAASVRRVAQGKARPIEVTLLDDSAEEEDEPDPEAEPEEIEEAEPEPDESSKEDDPTDKSEKPDPTAKEEPEQPEEKEKEQEKEKEKEKEEEDKPKNELVIEKLPMPERQKRIAVQQHVDPNQADNPDAEFIADQANKVKEQTQARITSTDQNDPQPTPGTSMGGPPDEPGNGELDKVAQNEDREGDPDRAPQEVASRAEASKPPESKGPAEPRPAEATGVERRQDGAAQGAEKTANKSLAPGQAGQRAQQASKEQEAAPETLSSEAGGGFSIGEKREASIQQSARRAKKKRELPRQRSGKPGDLLGLGAPGTSPGGVNLNLAPRVAVAAIGEDKLWRERQADGQRRRSAHRGSWKTGGIERWRSAIENYVPSVKPGNQTALNSARVPFASYLNMVHNRLHPIFADGFLASLGQLPGSHPMNDPNLVTHLEIVLDKDEGRLVRMGVTKSSGVTAFDVSALSSVDRAQPFGPPPREIVSPDGNVYFHWEFYRQPQFACSTYYAHPYILKTAPKPAPGTPGPAPEAPPSEDYKPPPAGERHGFDQRDQHDHDDHDDHDHEG